MSEMPMPQVETTLSVDVNETLRFFDEKPGWSVKHATAVVAVLGEDLAAAALKHCLERNKARNIKIRPEPVATGKKKGPWLDRWIEADLHYKPNVLFQTEIKSWSAHATDGKVLRLDACPEQVAELKRQTWNGQWNSRRRTLRHSATAKVLVRMKPPQCAEHRRLLPMLIYWKVVDPRLTSDIKVNAIGDYLFRIPNVTYDFPFPVPESWDCSQRFRELWVVSVSSYLRDLRANGTPDLKLAMPAAADRIQALNRLVKLPIE